MRKVSVVLLFALIVSFGSISSADNDIFKIPSGNDFRGGASLRSVSFTPIVNGLRVRATPSLSGSVLGHLNIGDFVTSTSGSGPEPSVHADGYDWIYITRYSDGLSGWVAFKYLQISG